MSFYPTRSSRGVTRSRRMEKMQTTASKRESGTTHSHGIVYRTACRNPGCEFEFDLRITPENSSILSGLMACPHCKRRGGQLKSQGVSAKSSSPQSYCFARPELEPRNSNKAAQLGLPTPVRSKLGEGYGDAKVYRCLRRDRSVLPIDHPLSCNKQAHRRQVGSNQRAAESNT